MSSGATSSAGRAKKLWGSAGRVWRVLVAMGVAWAGMGGGGGYEECVKVHSIKLQNHGRL